MGVFGRPAKYSTPEELEEKLDEYFTEDNKPYTITGVALHLGFESRQSFYDMEKNQDFSYIIKRARLYVENGYEQLLQNTGGSGAIFALKNMGWKDKQETEISGELSLNSMAERLMGK